MIDIVFVAWNRRDFTEAALTTLVRNTNWDHVDRLVIYDDGSTDGTRTLINDHLPILRALPIEVEVRTRRYGSPVAVMQNHVNDLNARTWFAKIDNDVCVPPGWLDAMLDVAAHHPELDLVGMEAGMTRVAGRDGAPWDGNHTVEACSHIGGVGLMRTSMFRRLPPLQADGRNGFTEFQHTYNPHRAWITPDLPIVLLDRLPFEPWLSLSAEYVRLGWQRPWPTWDPVWMAWAFEWFAPEQAAEAVA